MTISKKEHFLEETRKMASKRCIGYLGLGLFSVFRTILLCLKRGLDFSANDWRMGHIPLHKIVGALPKIEFIDTHWLRL